MEYLPEFIDKQKLTQCIKSEDISEVYRAIKVITHVGLPFKKFIADDYLVDIRLDLSTDSDFFAISNCEILQNVKYLLRHVKIKPIIVDSLLDVIKCRINESNFDTECDLDLLLATLHQIKIKHGMEFTNKIDELFQYLIKQNLFSKLTECKLLVCHSLLPYFLNPYNENRLKKLLSLNRLDIICALHKYFISKDVNLPDLWSQVQIALRTSQQKKSAIFLLKQQLELSKDDTLFQPANSAQYDNLIQLLEASDAKQLHLLQPSMHLLHLLNELHLSWQVTAWIVYLSHPHLAVIETTLCSLLDADWWLKDKKSFEELLPLVLRGFNMSSRLDVYNKCGAFLQQVGEQQMNSIRQHCYNVAWTPTAFYHFHKALLPYLTLDSVSILSLLKCLQAIPDKNVRDTFMELYLKPKILQYIAYDKNFERTIKEVFYAVFLHYYNGNNMKLLNSSYLVVVDKSLTYSYNITSLYQISTVCYSYLQFLIILKFHERNSNDFIKLSHKYLSETFSEAIVNEFGIDILYEALIAPTPTLLNTKSMSTDLIKILTDAKINFAKRSIALQIYSCLPSDTKVEDTDENILTHWTEMLLSGEYRFDESTCNAFLKLHKLVCNLENICNIIITTQTDLVVVTFFEYLPGDMEHSILKQCCNKLIDMNRSNCFQRACDAFLSKLSLPCYLKLLNIKSFHALFKESLHVRYVVTNKWIEMKDADDKRILNLAFHDCLLAETIHSKKEKKDFNIMMEILTHENRHEELLHQWYCYKAQVVILNAMAICSKFKFSDVLALCETQLEKKFQKRYYLDSQTHLEKIRIYQLLLLTRHDTAVTDQRYETIFKYLYEENNQNDVKQFQMLLLTNIEFYEKICDLIFAVRADSNGVRNAIQILYHIVRYEGSEIDCSDAIQNLIYYTMAANFKQRLISQMAIRYLLRHAKEMEWTKIVEKYSEVNYALEFFYKDIDWINDLDYMIHFNPTEHYTAETILFDIPRLNNVCEQEWRLYPYLFKQLMSDNKQFCELDLFSTDRTYSELQPTKTKLNEKFDIKLEQSVENLNNLVQRKPQTDYIDSSENGDRRIQVNSGLIVVASTVDSIANLGGLARTCHILGAATLVIHDVQVTKTTEFKSLSMSAERWQDIQEVKMDKIGDYLLRMRNEGYAIIGAEQTNQSVLLNDHPFQNKTIVLLGNERTGISADLLTMLDICVEIPQYGVVRSLNVHVAAALIIYEYSQKIKTIQK